MKSWLPIPSDSPFSVANIPFGVISQRQTRPYPRIAIAIGGYALDLDAFAQGGGFCKLPSIQPHLSVFAEPALNALAATGLQEEIRKYVQSVLVINSVHPEILRTNHTLRRASLVLRSEVKLHIPFKIGDYTDFYAGYHHAFNAGTIFRGADNALQPNYKHLPVAYHGRASTVVVSGTPIRRPCGQILSDPQAKPPIPTMSPCKKLDIELELAAFISKPNDMGSPIKVQDAAEHIFGYVLMNDWSARDIQAWEYVPLGPFNGKNFGTTVSPWVVLPDALEPYRTEGVRTPDTPLLPYLQETRLDTAFDIDLEVRLRPAGATKAEVVAKTNSKYLLFSFSQMLAHHTISGCAMQTGDLLGSGTISGPQDGSEGSFLEQSKGGREAFKVGSVERMFLEDGDEVTLTGLCGEDGAYVGFGDCAGVIEAAIP